MKKKTKNTNKNESVAQAVNSIKGRPYYITVVILWIIYLFIILISPNTTPRSFHLSDQVIMWFKVTIALPYFLIWLAATYSYVKIKRYAMAIYPSSESNVFQKIAQGIMLILISVVLSVLISALKNIFVDNAILRPTFTILTNYSYILPYLAAFMILLNSTSDLIQDQFQLKITPAKYLLYGIPLFIFAYLWLELIFTNHSRVHAGVGSKFATYYLNDSLLVLTIVIPSLITWVVGLLSIVKLRMYYKAVNGVIYKRALSSLVYGFVGVIFASLFLQALLSLGPQRLLDLGLQKLLFIIYLFLLIQAVGFFFIARGANNLTKIEAV